MIRCCGGSAPASPTKADAALRLHQPSVAHSLRSNRASDRWPAPTKAASPTLVSKKRRMHLVGKSVIDVVVHTKATTYPPNKMQLKAILNHVEKQKGFVYHAIFWNDDRTALLASLRPHSRSRPVCSGCGRKGPGYDTLAERRFEFVPLWAIPVFFLYCMRRVDCPRCGVTVEKVPWADGKHQSTFS